MSSALEIIRSRASAPTELDRITALPRVEYSPTGDIQRELQKPGCGWVLRPIQEAALMAIRDCGGAFLPIGVGHGKSIIACLAATVLDRQLAIILCPASTRRQLEDIYTDLVDHYEVRQAVILSYSVLSQPSGTTLLEELISDYSEDQIVLVCDEAHKIKRQGSARTKRVLRFMVAHPGVAFVALSGTMTSKSLDDMKHLSEMALRDSSPVPRQDVFCNRWSTCLDVDARPSHQDWQWIYPLTDWHGVDIRPLHGEQRVRVAREAFRDRLWSAPGVVATREGSIGCSLWLKLLDDLPIDPCVQTLLDQVADGFDPQGELILDDITGWRHARHLLAGFWYRWIWPNGIPDEPWLDARRTWHRWVRAQLDGQAAEGYDSPLLVSNRIGYEYANGSRREIHLAWKDWQDQKHKPAPPVEPVWVSSALVDYGANWLSREGGILWYSSTAVGDALRELGICVYGAGANPPTQAHPCAMSIAAHGVGKNLQDWSRALVLEPPSNGSAWEQLIGRLHRLGQKADEVSFHAMHHADPFRRALESAALDARYIESTSGNRQKLLYATYIS